MVGSSLTVTRELVSPEALPQGGLSRVAVATYAKLQGQDGSAPTVASQVVDTAQGRRRIVEVASAQDQANRIEEALKGLFVDEQPDLPFPRISIPLRDGEPPLTIFDLPHRSSDEILYLTDYFEQVPKPTLPPPYVRPERDVTYFFRRFPLSLILGDWNSRHDPHFRFARLITARIVGFGPLSSGDGADQQLLRGATRRDPIITGSALVEPGKNGAYSINYAKKPQKKANLSSVGLGDVSTSAKPSNEFLLERITQSVALSIAGINAYHFPVNGKVSDEVNAAGRRVLIDLALLALRLLIDQPMHLRSGCNLDEVPGTLKIETIGRDGRMDAAEHLGTVQELLERYVPSVDVARNLGLAFERDIVANPMPRLVELYEKRDKRKTSSEDDQATTEQ